MTTWPDESKLTSDLTSIQNELNAPKNQYNSFGKYSYRNCEDIQSALKPLLKKYGCKLTITDSIEVHGDRVYLVATVRFYDHLNQVTESKAYARESDSKKGMSSEQVSGSASSYARKYALGGMFLIDDQKDPDSDDNKLQQEFIDGVKSIKEEKMLTEYYKKNKTKVNNHEAFVALLAERKEQIQKAANEN